MSDTASLVEDEVELAGAPVSMAELIGLDTSDIEERRGFTFPKGLFIWEIDKTAELKILENKDGEKQAIINVPLNCIGVMSAAIDDHSKCIGQKQFENFRIKKDDPQETIGQFKALCADIGYSGSSVLGEMINGLKEMKFVGAQRHSPNKDDPDNPWSNLDRRKIRPLTDEELGQLAA